MISTSNNLYSFRCWLYIVSLWSLEDCFTTPLAPQKTHSHSRSFGSLLCALHTLLQGLLCDTEGSFLVVLNFFIFNNSHLNI